MHGIRVLMAKKYVDNLSEETKKGMLEKAEQGFYPSMAPFGYLNDRMDKTIVIDPQTAPIVQKIYGWYSSGDYTLKDLRKKAKAEGLLEGLSKYTVGVSTLEKVLKSVFYFGHFTWNGKEYEGKHTPIIDKGLWETVQDVFANKSNCSQGKREKDPFLFSGLMKCSKCGCHITAQRQKGKYVYYRCTNGRGKCSQPFVREEVIEEQYLKVLEAIHFPNDKMEWLKEALLLSHKNETDYHHETIEHLQKEYQAIQRKIDLMYDDKLEGNITQEYWQTKYQEMSQKQKEVTQSLELHKNADTQYIEMGLKLVELGRNTVSLYKRLSFKEKRELLSILLLNSVLDDGVLTVTYNPPFDSVVDCTKSQNWLPCAVLTRSDFVWLRDTC